MSREGELPQLDFSTFLLSLSTSAMMHLGDATDPSGKMVKNIPLARQTIDMLALLQEKTRGNLTEDEEKLLETQLYTLRMRYIEAVAETRMAMLRAAIDMVIHGRQALKNHKEPHVDGPFEYRPLGKDAFELKSKLVIPERAPVTLTVGKLPNRDAGRERPTGNGG